MTPEPSRPDLGPLLRVATVILVVAVLYLVSEVLLPLALAILLSFLLTPLCDRLEKWG